MTMEAEVRTYLLIGFSIVVILAIVVISLLWKINKSTAYAWFLAHLLFLSLSITLWLSVINNSNHSMLSENNSLKIGTAGIIWGISVVCMLTGIYKLKPINSNENKFNDIS